MMHSTISLRIVMQHTMTLFYRILHFREYLTCRAKMRSALANDDALDCGTANRAGFALAAINPEMVLEISATIDPVYAGAVAADAFLQYLPDCHPQDLGFFQCYRIRRRQWVEFGQVQSFISIDVTHTCQEGLVEQERLELTVLGLQRGMQPGRGKFIRERLRAKVLEDLGRIVHQPDPPKLARVRKDQRSIIRQLQ